jgi:polyisoprenoid-binding protein YceI
MSHARSTRKFALLSAATLLALAGCRDKQPDHLAPTASALASVTGSSHAVPLQVDPSSSKVSFLMEAPIEKIFGDAPASVTGELFVDFDDVQKSSALIKVDLDRLTVYQQKREDEQGSFGERAKNPTQNEHVRTWLEISPDTPADLREKNRFAEFRITRLSDASFAKLSSLPGADRKITARAIGDLRLHGRSAQKSLTIEISAHYEGDSPKEVRIRSLTPLVAGLEEYDVRPREAFGKLAQRTLDALGTKVAKSAPIEVDFVARAR